VTATLGAENMKTISCITVAILLLGCVSTPHTKSLSVGMPFRNAAALLESADAKQGQMDMLDQTETDLIKSYRLTDGRVLVISVVKSTSIVSALEVCHNAEQPKSKRKWSSHSSVNVMNE
jgi:hypothetical protein